MEGKIRCVVVLVFLLSSMNYPASAQTGWFVGQVYQYHTTWSLSEEYFDGDNVLISSEHLNEEQNFKIKITDLREVDEEIVLQSLFDPKSLDGTRDSVFVSGSDFTYIHSYNYNQSFIWFIPLIYSSFNFINQTESVYDIVFNSFDFEFKNYVTGFNYYDYMRYITSYLFIDPDFKSINNNIGLNIKDLNLYNGNPLINGHYVMNELTIKDLEQNGTPVSFMGESNLDDGISKLSSSTQEWTLSFDMTNSTFSTYQRNPVTHENIFENRVYDKYISSIELSYTDEGLLESLITKVDKVSTGENNSISTLFEKTIQKRESVINFDEIININSQYLPYLNGLLIAAIVVLLVKRIKIKKINMKKEVIE